MRKLTCRQAGNKPHYSNLGLRVRRATLRDLDTLVHQRRAMWVALGITDRKLHKRADRAYRRWAETRLINRQLLGWLVETRDGKFAGGGCLWLQPIQPSPRRKAVVQPYLLSMYTEPQFRRLGVASMVVDKAIEWCRKKGFQRLTLHASELGQKVYMKLGFKRTREMRLDLEKRKTTGHTGRRRLTVRRANV